MLKPERWPRCANCNSAAFTTRVVIQGEWAAMCIFCHSLNILGPAIVDSNGKYKKLERPR